MNAVAPFPVTLPKLKKFNRSAETARLRDAVTNARAEAKRIRSEVATLLAPVFARFTFVDDEGNRITDEDKLYMSDDDCSAWDRVRHETLTAAGYDTADGRCPALVAESAAREAVIALLQHATEQLGLNFIEIWRCSRRELAEQAVDLLMNGPKH